VTWGIGIPRFTFSGPIERGRFWFFGRHQPAARLFLVKELP